MPVPTHGGHDIAAKLNEKLMKDNEGLLLTSATRKSGSSGFRWVSFRPGYFSA